MKYNNFGRMVHWGCSGPEVLQNTIWFLLCVHMGMRGRDEHYKLTLEIWNLNTSYNIVARYNRYISCHNHINFINYKQLQMILQLKLGEQFYNLGGRNNPT